MPGGLQRGELLPWKPKMTACRTCLLVQAVMLPVKSRQVLGCQLEKQHVGMVFPAPGKTRSISEKNRTPRHIRKSLNTVLLKDQGPSLHR